MDHVFVIVMENHSFGEIVGSTSAPYFNSLIPAGGLGSKYYAVTHPSLPNYLALAGASTFGITSDCTTCWVNASNIADKIEGVGSTWKAYMESMPSACFIGDSYPYAQKHNPFIYFNDIRTNSTRCAQHILPYTQMSTDLQSTTTTPNYAFITPNMCNDTHDCAVSSGDNWLKAQVPVILGSPAFKTQHSLLAIVWDEDDSSARVGGETRRHKPDLVRPLLAAPHDRERPRRDNLDRQRHSGAYDRPSRRGGTAHAGTGQHEPVRVFGVARAPAGAPAASKSGGDEDSGNAAAPASGTLGGVAGRPARKR